MWTLRALLERLGLSNTTVVSRVATLTGLLLRTDAPPRDPADTDDSASESESEPAPKIAEEKTETAKKKREAPVLRRSARLAPAEPPSSDQTHPAVSDQPIQCTSSLGQPAVAAAAMEAVSAQQEQEQAGQEQGTGARRRWDKDMGNAKDLFKWNADIFHTMQDFVLPALHHINKEVTNAVSSVLC